MAERYVYRNQSGAIAGSFTNLQPGVAEELLAGDDPELTAFEEAALERLILSGALTISDRQFFQQLALSGIISEAEAEAAVATGTIPAAMLALVDALPSEQRFGARMMLKGAVEFRRDHPLTNALAAMYGWSNEQVDALFEAAAAL